MYVTARYISFLILIINLFVFMSANDEISVFKDRGRRHLFPLLGYLHGFKIGQSFALQLPPFVLSPVIIVPSVNQQQSVNIQKSSPEENYQESGGIIQNISPARLVTNSSINSEEIKELNHSIKSVNNEDVENNSLTHSEFDTFRQANVNETNISTETQENIDEYLTTTPYDETTVNRLESFKIKNVTKPSGPYPNAVYNNDNLSTLSITAAPLQYDLTVPNKEDRWQNFSEPVTLFENDTTKNVDSDNLNSTLESVIVFPTTELTSMTKSYPYPNPVYNAEVGQLSITTNSYTNEAALPPTHDDRWHRFSSLTKSYPSSGFRPLAGLYYDGFLHKPLIKDRGFMPYRSNGYYYI